MQFDVRTILKRFDRAAENYEFPMLDNGYYFHGDQKLTLYRDPERWAMTIEALAFNNHELDIYGITNHVTVFGNCILSKKHNDNDNFFVFTEDDGVPAFVKDDNTYISYLNPEVKNIKVKNKLVPVIHDRQHYYAKGIILEYPDKIVNYEFMRGLIPDYSDLFWVTREEIANKIPLDLPVLMTLREWYHPDLVMEEMPGKNETFQQLAAVIASGDISAYSPTRTANTHWRNWPEGGAL
jgi:hypothetical protein